MLTKKKYINNTFNYIKEQIINSELYSIINLHKINWELIWEQSQKSKVIECWELWNNGIYDVSKIAKILNSSSSNVGRWLSFYKIRKPAPKVNAPIVTEDILKIILPELFLQ